VRYARIGRGQRDIEAAEAANRPDYTCPSCGGGVFLRSGSVREAHFAHYAGGTPDCEEYHSGSSTGTAGAADDPDLEEELELVADAEDDWSLALRLPGMADRDLGGGSLPSLQNGAIEVFAGDVLVRRVSALDVRPGTTGARALVPPTSNEYRTEPVGRWPPLINLDRWRGNANGLGQLGTLFRFRGGEWTRAAEGSVVRWGDRLVVVANERSAPPRESSPVPADLTATSTGRWRLWRIVLPEVPTDAVANWLDRLGYAAAPPKWRVTALSVPQAYDEARRPSFFVGEPVLLKIVAPSPSGATSLHLCVGEHDAEFAVRAAVAEQVLRVTSTATGLVTATLAIEDRPHADFVFVARPSLEELRATLRALPRLRIWLDERCLEPWESDHWIERNTARVPCVRVEPGVDDVRVAVVTFASGGRRASRRLRSEDAAVQVAEALADPACAGIEIDAGPLGAIRIQVKKARDLVVATRDRRAGWIRNSTAAPGASRGAGCFVARAVASDPQLVGCAVVGVRGAAAAQLRAVARLHEQSKTGGPRS
jgi:hypothetical protein